jgi:RNA polymerase I-specific transcription initiation factor RRN3
VNQFNLKLSQVQGVPQLIQLRLWFSALSHVVSRLERTHSVLVDAIVNMPWTTLDTTTVKSYTVFMGMLVSARPEYLSLVLSKIAQGFTHRAYLSFVYF